MWKSKRLCSIYINEHLVCDCYQLIVGKPIAFHLNPQLVTEMIQYR
jgi:hypothetical protein